MEDKMTGRDKQVALLDKNLRKSIADYYFALEEMQNPEVAIKLLADHVAIMVEMINDMKSDIR